MLASDNDPERTAFTGLFVMSHCDAVLGSDFELFTLGPDIRVPKIELTGIKTVLRCELVTIITRR